MPILIVCNRFNPSILNVFTVPKQSLPISIDFKFKNRFKFNSIKFNSLLQLQLGIFKLLIDESNLIKSFNGIGINLDSDSFTSICIRNIQFKFNTWYWWWFHMLKWFMAIPFIQCYLSHIWNIYIILIHSYYSNSILSNISDIISIKLPPSSFLIDCNEGRSIFIQFISFYHYFALSIYFFHQYFLQIMQPRPIW